MSEVNKNLGHATAYGYAKSQGYAGTEEEFAALMAGYADVGQRAETAATAAAESAAAAEASENAAKTSETIAVSAALTATTASQNASESATAASNSATAASASAVTASSAATAASGSASTASAKASEASGSATAASASAAAASVSASSASASASSAAVSASSAESAAASLVVDPTLTQAGQPADAKVVGDDISSLKSQIDTKANKNGTYPDMTVGNAEQLVATVGIEDKVPYLFRTSGGSVDIGDREVDMLVGGTVAWNQHSKSGIAGWGQYSGTVAITASDEEVVFTGSTSAWQAAQYFLGPSGAPSNHIALVMFEIKASTSGITLSDYGSYSYRGECPTNWTRYSKIAKPTVGSYYTGVKVTDGGDTGTISLRNVVAFDLTQMFGTEIAGYIFSLETATPGSGVAWFRKFFPAPYYAYDEGTLKSVEATSHDMVGFNAWDEEWEVGGISDITGENNSATACIRSKNYIPVLPDTQYYFCCDGWGSANNVRTRFYRYDKTYIGYKQKNGNDVTKNTVFTTPEDCCFMRFVPPDVYGTTYQNDICINLSWDGERDGEYEPYVKHSYTLDSDLVLRGIPKLDADNKLYYDGDTYEGNGTVTRKYGIVDLGTLTWNTSGDRMYAQLEAQSISGWSYALICPKYLPSTYINQTTPPIDLIMGRNNSNIFIYDSAYSDPAVFKTAMSGIYLLYELAAVSTETADTFQNPQIVDDFGTEEYVSNTIVPVGHVTQYKANLRAKLEMAPDSPSGNGDYIVRQTDGNNEYVPLVIPTELPSSPSTDGTYTLKVTVASGTPTLAWVADS